MSGPNPSNGPDPSATTTTLPAVDSDLVNATGAGNGIGNVEAHPAAWGEAPPGVPQPHPGPNGAPSGISNGAQIGVQSGVQNGREPNTDEIHSALGTEAPPAMQPMGAPAPAMPVPTMAPPVPHGGFAPIGAPGPAPVQQQPTQPGRQPKAAKPVRPQRRGGDRAPRRAHLQLKHIDAWSVLKLSCVLSVSLFFVWLVVVGVLYGTLDVSGVIGKINDTAHTLYNNQHDPVTPGIVLGGALVIGVINIVLFIVLATIGSIVYNLCADLVGGVEVTLSERQ